MAGNRVKVGIIGCGNISAAYLSNLTTLPNLEVVACADLDVARAHARAAEYNVQNAYTVEQLLADPDIDIVVNLTIPNAHAQVCIAALQAGKHVHVEKPLSISLDDGRRIVALAREKGLRVGAAPDTFMGGGLQTCRAVIDSGRIGQPIAATAFMLGHGHESWHPDPEFYYQEGGGPMFDMGPYYLTALVSLMGAVKRVTGSAQVTFPERIITSEPKRGQVIHVKTPTHIAGVFDFVTGAVGNMITSFDVWGHELPFMEIYGTEGTLSLPDPNTFGGSVRVRDRASKTFEEVPYTHGLVGGQRRGLAVADMALAIQEGRPHRANGDLAFHVLEIMHGFHIASAEGIHYQMTSTCERPAPLKPGDESSTVLDVL